jgi:hypothetical protein
MNNARNIFNEPGERQPVFRTQFNGASLHENGIPSRVIDSAQPISAGCFIEARPHDTMSPLENLLKTSSSSPSEIQSPKNKRQ